MVALLHPIPSRAHPPRLDAVLADYRSSLICQVLRPQLRADESAWITGLSEAVSSAPPQHQ
eukprot:3522196-Prorocentrum_lima.AAC.1